MNKTELIDAVAKGAGLSKVQAKEAVDCYHAIIAGTLKEGNSVDIAGFGSFSVSPRAARTGRNPKTGEPLQIKATNVPKFKAGKGLKEGL